MKITQDTLYVDTDGVAWVGLVDDDGPGLVCAWGPPYLAWAHGDFTRTIPRKLRRAKVVPE